MKKVFKQNVNVLLLLTMIILVALFKNEIKIKADESEDGVTIASMFPDGNLAQAIANSVEKNVNDNILQSDLDKITTIKGSSISKIDGIENVKNLNELTLDSGSIRDISLLSSLTNITSLYMGGNKIRDLTPLSLLVNLESLSLWGNEIRDISPISGLNKVSYLSIEKQNIELEQQPASNPLVIDNTIKNLSGDLVEPSNISDNGTYSNETIIFSGIGGQSKVSHYFSVPIKIGKASATFSGTVMVPLDNTNVTKPVITAKNDISYEIGNAPENFLSDIDAKTDNGSPITSNVASVVNLSKVGDYKVELYSTDNNGNQADPLPVTVHVIEPVATSKPIINSREEVTYKIGTNKLESDFIKDINAQTDEDVEVTSDFSSKVDLNTEGEYVVTLTSKDSDGNEADPVNVTVYTTKEDVKTKPIINAKMNVTYNQGDYKDEQDFLYDIDAKTDDGSVVNSNFEQIVDLNTAGQYDVTLTSKDLDENEADPLPVSVRVNATLISGTDSEIQSDSGDNNNSDNSDNDSTISSTISSDKKPNSNVPLILAKTDVTYKSGMSRTESAFLKDINASATDGSRVESDFDHIVDLNNPGNYLVTLRALQSNANSLSVIVRITGDKNLPQTGGILDIILVIISLSLVGIGIKIRNDIKYRFTI